MQDIRDLTITLNPDEANAAMAAIELALMAEGERLGSTSPSDSPGEFHRLGKRATRIGAYANLGEALAWRTHWGFDGGSPVPEPVTAPESVWVDLLGELTTRADEVRRIPDMEPDDVFEFDRALRTVAHAIADAGLVVA